jgi:3-hydroxyacyl-CoA dehydrogenase/3a,7a,12a-trihydroxy-5b-cholest-24-enoyl-CoA hydratase
VFNVTDPAASKSFSLGGNTTATLTISDADLPALATGNVKSLYQHGKLKVDGDVTVAHRLGFLKGLI